MLRWLLRTTRFGIRAVVGLSGVATIAFVGLLIINALGFVTLRAPQLRHVEPTLPDILAQQNFGTRRRLLDLPVSSPEDAVVTLFYSEASATPVVVGGRDNDFVVTITGPSRADPTEAGAGSVYRVVQQELYRRSEGAFTSIDSCASSDEPHALVLSGNAIYFGSNSSIDAIALGPLLWPDRYRLSTPVNTWALSPSYASMPITCDLRAAKFVGKGLILGTFPNSIDFIAAGSYTDRTFTHDVRVVLAAASRQIQTRGSSQGDDLRRKLADGLLLYNDPPKLMDEDQPVDLSIVISKMPHDSYRKLIGTGRVQKESFPVYPVMRASLDGPPEDFDIIRVPRDDLPDKNLNQRGRAAWQWHVLPKRGTKKGTTTSLTLQIQATMLLSDTTNVIAPARLMQQPFDVTIRPLSPAAAVLKWTLTGDRLEWVLGSLAIPFAWFCVLAIGKLFKEARATPAQAASGVVGPVLPATVQDSRPEDPKSSRADSESAGNAPHPRRRRMRR